MIGLESANVLLSKNSGLTTLGIIGLFVVMSYNSVQTNRNSAETNIALDQLASTVEEQMYNSHYLLISRGFAGAQSGAEALAQTKIWTVDEWDAQLVALDVLCDQPGRISLNMLVDSSTAVNICRIVR